MAVCWKHCPRARHLCSRATGWCHLACRKKRHQLCHCGCPHGSGLAHCLFDQLCSNTIHYLLAGQSQQTPARLSLLSQRQRPTRTSISVNLSESACTGTVHRCCTLLPVSCQTLSDQHSLCMLRSTEQVGKSLVENVALNTSLQVYQHAHQGDASHDVYSCKAQAGRQTLLVLHGDMSKSDKLWPHLARQKTIIKSAASLRSHLRQSMQTHSMLHVCNWASKPQNF